MTTFKIIISTVFIFFCFQQTVLAQSYKEYELDTYTQVILVVVLLLIATIFIGFTILDDPKYMVSEPIEKEIKTNVTKTSSPIEYEKMRIPKSSIDLKYELDSKIISLYKLSIYSIILLSAIYLLIILFLKII